MTHKIKIIVQWKIFHHCLDCVHNTSCLWCTVRRSIKPSCKSQVFANGSLHLTKYLYGSGPAYNNRVGHPACCLPVTNYHLRSKDFIV